MTLRLRTGIVCLVFVQGLVACGRSSAPSAPSPVSPTAPQPTPPPSSGITFMRGTVSDTAFRSLAGARVEVLDGPQAGMSTTTDSDGGFSFNGSFDVATRFRASKEGHVTDTETLQPFCARCNPNWWINFSLLDVAPP